MKKRTGPIERMEAHGLFVTRGGAMTHKASLIFHIFDAVYGYALERKMNEKSVAVRVCYKLAAAYGFRIEVKR